MNAGLADMISSQVRHPDEPQAGSSPILIPLSDLELPICVYGYPPCTLVHEPLFAVTTSSRTPNAADFLTSHATLLCSIQFGLCSVCRFGSFISFFMFSTHRNFRDPLTLENHRPLVLHGLIHRIKAFAQTYRQVKSSVSTQWSLGPSGALLGDNQIQQVWQLACVVSDGCDDILSPKVLLNGFGQRRCELSARPNALDFHPGGLWGGKVTYQQEMCKVVAGGELLSLYKESVILRWTRAATLGQPEKKRIGPTQRELNPCCITKRCGSGVEEDNRDGQDRSAASFFTSTASGFSTTETSIVLYISFGMTVTTDWTTCDLAEFVMDQQNPHGKLDLKINATLKRLDQLLALLDGYKPVLEHNANSAAVEIKANFDGLIDALHQRQVTLLKQLDKVYKEKIALIDSSKQTIEALRAGITSCVSTRHANDSRIHDYISRSAPFVSFRADRSTLHQSIANYGRVASRYSGHFADPSQPSTCLPLAVEEEDNHEESHEHTTMFTHVSGSCSCVKPHWRQWLFSATHDCTPAQTIKDEDHRLSTPILPNSNATSEVLLLEPYASTMKDRVLCALIWTPKPGLSVWVAVDDRQIVFIDRYPLSAARVCWQRRCRSDSLSHTQAFEDSDLTPVHRPRLAAARKDYHTQQHQSNPRSSQPSADITKKGTDIMSPLSDLSWTNRFVASKRHLMLHDFIRSSGPAFRRPSQAESDYTGCFERLPELNRSVTPGITTTSSDSFTILTGSTNGRMDDLRDWLFCDPTELGDMPGLSDILPSMHQKRFSVSEQSTRELVPCSSTQLRLPTGVSSTTTQSSVSTSSVTSSLPLLPAHLLSSGPVDLSLWLQSQSEPNSSGMEEECEQDRQPKKDPPLERSDLMETMTIKSCPYAQCIGGPGGPTCCGARMQCPNVADDTIMGPADTANVANDTPTVNPSDPPSHSSSATTSGTVHPVVAQLNQIAASHWSNWVEPKTANGNVDNTSSLQRKASRVLQIRLDDGILENIFQPSCFLRVVWQLGTDMALQLNDYFIFSVSYVTLLLDSCIQTLCRFLSKPYDSWLQRGTPNLTVPTFSQPDFEDFSAVEDLILPPKRRTTEKSDFAIAKESTVVVQSPFVCLADCVDNKTTPYSPITCSRALRKSPSVNSNLTPVQTKLENKDDYEDWLLHKLSNLSTTSDALPVGVDKRLKEHASTPTVAETRSKPE
ncbi:hypothetical protein CLF_108297 [Clonorchis sinensis]|uniref:Uncharacterized protein n=1 Tax=Clonorchis sinensis TaxID=79923 RepID=G7YRH5_CLOSI|nr:hypothetical protein CLF_108297 [Clonorchis sinensis]